MNNEKMYLNIINNLRDGVYFVDLERRITFWNRAGEEITGYAAEEIVGRKCEDNLLNHIDGEGRPLCITGCPLFACMIDNKPRREHVFLRHKDGRRIPALVNAFPMIEDGQTIGAIEIYTPGSPVICDDDLIGQLSDMAMNDQLTGLPNRSYLESFMEFKLNEFRRFDRLFAVLLLDIDRFNTFNSSHGRDIGDAVLRKIAAGIQQSVDKSDLFGRWGGVKFVGIFSISQPEDASILGEKIRELIANIQVPFGEEYLSVTASIGVAAVSAADTAETLVERAGRLMHSSKFRGKNCVSTEHEITVDKGLPTASAISPT